MKPELPIDDIFKCGILRYPPVEMVSGVRFSAVAIDGLVACVHPVGEPRQAWGEDRFLVDAVYPEVKLGEVDETAETQALSHLIDKALVISNLRLK